ncbi:MAG: tetratricopeptide repeat protein [Rhodothermales bacterium]|nr:tetratricopeptide repeat protein [Rhodothermales bacterium]MDG2016637.1 tetratricopeptide repeat protein [Rhodothermales bacterium]
MIRSILNSNVGDSGKALILVAIVSTIGAAPLDAYAQTPTAWSRPIEGSILHDASLLALADEALLDLYNMRYDRADSLFAVIEAQHPDHPIGPFLASLTAWWKILPTLSVHDTSQDRDFLRQMDRVIKKSKGLERKKKNLFDAAFFKTAAHGFRGRLLSDREEWLRAAQDGKAAMDHIFELAEGDTSNADLLFGVGVYDYFAEVIPERYPVVSPLMYFFPSGNKERGLQRLEKAAHEGRFVSAEAAYFLVQIFTSFQPDYARSMEYISMLRERYPGNALFHVMQGRIHFRWGQWVAAAAMFKEVVDQYDANAPGYVPPLVSQAHYYLGRRSMQQNKLTDAQRHFSAVLRLEAQYDYDSFFRVFATLRSGMVHDLQGEREEAKRAYRRVLDQRRYSSSGDRAKRYLKKPYGDQSP